MRSLGRQRLACTLHLLAPCLPPHSHSLPLRSISSGIPSLTLIDQRVPLLWEQPRTRCCAQSCRASNAVLRTKLPYLPPVGRLVSGRAHPLGPPTRFPPCLPRRSVPSTACMHACVCGCTCCAAAPPRTPACAGNGAQCCMRR